jgi:solute carrier family 13 (sodium-dependent dicarboxylate transporter), member 2/3/5
MRLVGLITGPVLAIVVFLILPEQYGGADGDLAALSAAGRATLALLAWMAIWWLTEAIDLAATALLPLVMLPLSGATDMKAAAAPYASEIVFLIMGGFILALSMQRWGLDRRIALTTLRIVGDKPVNMVGGVMLAAALMGGFVSNTAKAAMLLPVGLSLIEFVRHRHEREAGNFAVCVMLGIAYASSISGVSTIIGTPPNAFLAGFVRDEIAEPYRREISFATWLMIGLPLMIVFLPLAWLLLTRVLFPIGTKSVEGGREFIKKSCSELGRMNRGEWSTLIVFVITVLAWTFRQALVKIEIGNGQDAGGVWRPLAGLSDAVIAMAGALLLFIIPAGRQTGAFVMDWKTATKLPWGVLILFGGGLSLATAIEANGVAEFLAAQTRFLGGLPPILLLIAVTTAVVFFSEVASNTATATTLVPILAAIAPGLDVHPYFLIIPATLAASFAFMLPAGTPPNAIVFGTGHVTIRQMCWAGLWMNLIGVAFVVVATYAIIMPVLATG